MSTPRTKRQFAGAASDPAQRRITSFFPNNPTGTTTSSSAFAARGPLNAPILPAKIQSDLVNVGMRVRKALAERGQKLPDPAFHLWNDDAPASSLDKPLPASSTTYTTTGGELAPYSGIHKVGGLSVQPGFPVPSSQESTASTSEAMAVSAAATGNRKRIFDEEDDGASDGPTPPHAGPWRRREEWIESEISPRSVAPAGWGNARIMAVPRRSGRSDKAQAARTAAGAAQLGQENMVVDDFDEAPFLALEDEEGRMDM
ncbi:hypothetical protein B0T18DRAFT_406042 [Schizothecium vesticola]|uniref:Uncharacterized protein n=1 Tax=Schizothecium vesticola TaxID=314040 RepID=A0AA40F121_9PEZI|nr:hypothetical protein B0T18DRAFT_406042 [Schizothecium vesticola]